MFPFADVIMEKGMIPAFNVITAQLSFFPFQHLRTVGNMFIVNLAIADLAVTGFVDPFSIIGKPSLKPKRILISTSMKELGKN